MLCRAMTKTLDSTAVYAYTTLISMVVCLPFAIGMEGGALQAGAAAAIQKVGAPQAAAPSGGGRHDGFCSTTSSCWSSLPWFTFWVCHLILYCLAVVGRTVLWGLVVPAAGVSIVLSCCYLCAGWRVAILHRPVHGWPAVPPVQSGEARATAPVLSRYLRWGCSQLGAASFVRCTSIQRLVCCWRPFHHCSAAQHALS